MAGFIRDIPRRFRGRRNVGQHVGGDARTGVHRHNLFEAAAVYVAASAGDDEERGAEAAGWVSPEALAFGVNELACRAVIALARERQQPPLEVARELLGLTPAP
ncbi:hypothetical protein ACWC2K_06755 [Streptomyces chattanoogensis]|uniref:hypothetical protein n=1 Tax=Streptomyces chattanoogensis TaxID=66876 RepID=UPI00367E1E62